MKIPDPAIAALSVDLFNACTPPGSEVLYAPPRGAQRKVRTISRAQLVGGRTGRVKLADRVGWVSLGQVLIVKIHEGRA